MDKPFPAYLEPVLRDIVTSVALGDFANLERRALLGRCPRSDLEKVISDYCQTSGQKFVATPDHFLRPQDTVALSDGGGWLASLDLWSVDGRSDLTLELRVAVEVDRYNIQITDLRVM